MDEKMTNKKHKPTKSRPNKLKNKAKPKPKPEKKEMTPEVISELVTRFRSLRSVYDAHIDLNDQGEVYVIALFTDGSRTIKRMLREAEEVFYQVARYKVDFRKLSIVEQKKEVPIEPVKRVKIISADAVVLENGETLGTVLLEYEDHTFEETMQASPYEMQLPYVIAHAAAKALSRVTFETVHIECVKNFDMESVDVVAVTVSVVDRIYGSKEIYVGSVVKSEDIKSDVVKATLDAMNRRIHRHY
jgi:hypothetical protein